MPELGNKAPAHGRDVWVAAFSFSQGKPPTPRGFSKDHVRAHQFSEHGTFPGVGVAVLGHPIEVLSGFRDFDLGASHSQHKFGNAMDPTAALPHFQEVAKLKVFSGIGHFATSGLVRHVDVRHVGPNITGGSKTQPTIFVDAF
jgi:hypothetical protein